VRGAQDLVLKRTYVPPRILGRYDDKDEVDHLLLAKELCQLNTKGWVVLPHLWAGYNRHSAYFQIRDPQGFVLEFQIEGNKGILKTATFGCTNLRGESASSSGDLRNIQLLAEGNSVTVNWPCGLERHYLRSYGGTYLLQKEILSNGKTIRYEYDSKGLYKIVSSDPMAQKTYASITRSGDAHFIGSDGREVDLVYELREVKGRYKKKGYEEKLRWQFPVMMKASNPTYINTVGYNERTLLNSYDAKNYPVSCSYSQDKNSPARIQTFSNPAGSFSFPTILPLQAKKGAQRRLPIPTAFRRSIASTNFSCSKR